MIKATLPHEYIVKENNSLEDGFVWKMILLDIQQQKCFILRKALRQENGQGPCVLSEEIVAQEDISCL